MSKKTMDFLNFIIFCVTKRVGKTFFKEKNFLICIIGQFFLEKNDKVQ